MLLFCKTCKLLLSCSGIYGWSAAILATCLSLICLCLAEEKKKVLARLNIPLEIIDQSCGKIRVHMFSYEFVCNQNPSTSPSIFLILIQLLYNPLSIFTTLPPHTDTNIIITTRFPPKSSLSKIVCFPLCKCQKHHAAIVVKDNDNMDPQLKRGRWDWGTVV